MIPLPGAGRRGDIAVDRARAAAAAAASASSLSSSPPLDSLSHAAYAAHAQLDALASGIGLSAQQQTAQQQQLSRRSRSPPSSSALASSSRLPTSSPSSGIFVPRTSRTSAGVRKPLSRCSESELEGISERADALLRSAAVREKLAPAELERLRRDGEEARRRLEDIRRSKESEREKREEGRLVGRMEELELEGSPRSTHAMPAAMYGRSPTGAFPLSSSPTHTTDARRFVREREQSPTPGRLQLLSFQQASALERHTYEVQAAVERSRIEAATQRALARMGIKDDDAASLPAARAREREREGERERREQREAEEEQEEQREEMEGEGDEYAEDEWARGIEM